MAFTPETTNQSQHRHVDVNLESVTACPAAGANVTSAGIDTRSGGLTQPVTPSQSVNLYGSAALQDFELRVMLDYGTALVDTKAVTFKVQDSDDNSSFADVVGLASQTVTSSGGGNPTSYKRWKLPPTLRRYVAVNCSVPADAGAITAQNFTVDLLS